MMKSRKVIYSLCLICSCLFCIFSFGGCSNVKVIDVVTGSWSTSEFKIADNHFGNMEVAIEFSDEIDLTNIIQVKEQYLSVNIYLTNSENEKISIDGLAVTYYAKEMRIAFKIEQSTFYMTAKMKQNKSGIFLDAGIIFKNNSINLKIYQNQGD